MPKNRDYTGLVRAPPSLSWLIDKRARLKGQIERLEKQLAVVPEKMGQLKAQLDAIDGVIPLREVDVDPPIIKSIEPRKKILSQCGGMTKADSSFPRENQS